MAQFGNEALFNLEVMNDAIRFAGVAAEAEARSQIFEAALVLEEVAVMVPAWRWHP